MFRRLLDPLVPCSCWACDRPCPSGAALCDACSAALPWRAPQARPAAGLDAAWAGLEFAGPARSLVHALKFRGALGVAGLMAAQLAERAPALLVSDPARPLVPVPAHPGRLRRRGFDPAQLLARELAALTGMPVVHVLLRSGGLRDAQRGSGRSERLAGEHLAITARTPVRGGVVLVDDVWTTGATLRACAGALRAAGAAQVCAIAYARASGGGPRATIPASPSPKERCPMQIDVKGLNVPVTDELREQVEKRFGTIAKQVAELATLDVILSEERNPAIKEAQKAEANLHLKGVTLNAKAHAAEMRAAIAAVAEELQRQVARHREKVRGHRKVGTPSIRTATPEEA